MGIKEKLKEFYLEMEDSYYNQLDKLNKKFPVYKAVDKIDDVVPSFPLFTLIFLLLVIGFLILPLGLGQFANLTVKVSDVQGNPLAGAAVKLSLDGEIRKGTTNELGEFIVSLTKGTTLEIETRKEGFAKDNRTVVLAEDKQEEKISLAKVSPLDLLKKIVKFSDATGKSLLGRNVTAEFSCSSGKKLLKSKYTTTSGEIELIPPEGCGELLVKIFADGFESGSFVVQEGEVIKLSAAEDKGEAAEGSVTIRVVSSNGELLENMQVELRNNSDAKVDEGVTSWGEKTFIAVAGAYYVVVADPAAEYASKTSESFQITPNSQSVQEITLSKEIKATVKIKVLDKETNAPISGAKVLLKNEEGEVVGAEQTVDASGEAVFGLQEIIKVYAVAMHKDYLSEPPVELDTLSLARGASLSHEIKLEFLTEENSGLVYVTVKDEDDKEVENATVYLFYAETEFLCDGCGERITDDNGTTEPAFKGVGEGEYYAVVHKYPAYGKSEIYSIKKAEVNRINVTLTIGDGLLKLKAVDPQNDTIEFAKAEIYTEDGEKVGTVTLDNKGEAEYKIKADKKIYVVFSKDGYTNYVTAAVQVFPDVELPITAVMESEILGTSPELLLLGVFTKEGSPTENLSPGRRYTAKFQLKIPNQLDNVETGIHVRTGDDTKDVVEKDDWFINKVNAPLALAVKGNSFNPPNGSAELTNSNAKWVDVIWDEGLEAGIYNVEIELKVKQTATGGKELPLHYRAWVIDETGRYLRTPLDAELGTERETSEKGELYALTYDQFYFIGAESKCDELFCYSERVLDLEELLYLEKPYALTIFQDNLLEFDITNNSSQIYDDAEIRIRTLGKNGRESDTLLIKEYEITNADSEKFSDTGIEEDKLETISGGRFSQNKTIKGKITIEMKSESPEALEIVVVSSGNEVFKKVVQFTVVKADRLVMEITPEFLPSFTAFDVDVKVTFGKGEKEGLNVDDALVKIKKIAPDTSETKFSERTDNSGLAEFVIPASSPGSKLVFTVEKKGYRTEKVIKEISSEILEFAPEELKYVLNLISRKEEEKSITVTNRINQDIEIIGAVVSGEFDGLLDVTQMNNWLEQYVGTEIEKEESEIIRVKAALSDDADYLEEERLVRGNLLLDVKNEQGTAVWSLGVPFEVQIFLSEPPKYPDCVSLSIREWKDTTMENTISKEFRVRNTCVTSYDEPMPLKNLSARIDWQSDVIGDIELTLVDNASGEAVSQVLKQGIWSRLFNDFDEEKEYLATLTFIPYAETLGQRAVFNVEIDAQPRDARGEQFVGSSNLIMSEILVANLEQCVQYLPTPDEGVRLLPTMEEAAFTIDTSQCGNIDVDFRFCEEGKDQCRGGAVEGGIRLRPWRIDDVKPETPRTVTVERLDVPGLYGITVEARPEGGTWREIAVLDALIEPQLSYAFTLDKYDFTIIGDGSTDSVTLTNNLLSEQVMVSASVCDWAEVDMAAAKKAAATAGTGIAVAGTVAIYASTLTTTVATTATAAATTAPLLGAATSTVATAGIALIIIGIGMATGLLGGEDPCKESQTAPLIDYIINLSNDARSLSMDSRKIGVKWNIENPIVLGQFEKQEVGVVFNNKAGIKSQKPTYSTMVATAQRHHHAQPTIYSLGSRFGPFKVKDSKTTNQTDKFHLRFKTAEAEQKLPDVAFDVYSCNKGVLQGRNGPGVMPRQKFNWNWLEETGGIAYNDCDADNPNGVYCDATQFGIALTKRLAMFEGVLKANEYEFGCPANPIIQAVEEESQTNSQHTVISGKIGQTSVDHSLSGGNLTVDVEVKNKTLQSQSAQVTMRIAPPADVTLQETEATCTKTVTDIGALGSANVSCSFNDLPESDAFYIVSTEISSETTDEIDPHSFFVAFKVIEGLVATAECWLPLTTAEYDGQSAISRYITEDGVFTNEVRNADELNNLLHFRANLKYDAFSEDWREDFVDYYTNVNFADTHTLFYRLGSDNQGNYYGLKDYFIDNERLKFERKFVSDDYTLPGPGEYKVDIDIEFENARAELFDVEGRKNAKINVVFYNIKGPEYNHPLYYVPFDGHLGLESSGYNRQGYGVSYNLDSEKEVNISEGTEPVKTKDSSSSNALVELDVEIVNDLYEIGVSPSTSGNILTIDEGKDASEKSLIIFESYATPVLMKMHKDKITEEDFAAFYSLSVNDVPQEIGNTLAYWQGAGNCLNFDGSVVTEAFKRKADSAAVEADHGKYGLSTWQTAYGVEWDVARHSGDVYLRSIFYTPRDKDNVLKAITPNDLKFITPDTEGSTVALNGVTTMNHNRPGNSASDRLGSIEKMMQLIGTGTLCMNNTGRKADIWWDPNTIYRQAGQQGISVHDLAEGLEAGVSCIGFEGQEE